MATYELTSTIPAASQLAAGDVLNCAYSGTYKTIQLPAGTYKLECWGAQGGYYNSSYLGGKGGYSCGTITIQQNTEFYLYSGGQGSYVTSSGTAQGGYNGGGQSITSSTSYQMGSGGGGSDIRVTSNTINGRIIVAGGGGGAHYASTYRAAGGAGGGTSGVKGTNYSSSYTGGNPGTATSGGTSIYQTSSGGTAGSFGQGGYYSSYSTGGGGGWYGGGGARRAGAGGGSGYVYTSSTASQHPNNSALGSSYYLTDASTKAGNTSFTDYSGSTVTGHTGNGACRITVISVINSDGGFQAKIKTADNGSLPSNYIELDYIESTGTQYINTGFIAKDTSCIEYEAEYTNTATAQYNGTYNDKGHFMIGVNNNIIEYYLGSTAQASTDTMPKTRTYFRVDGLSKLCCVNDKIYPCTVNTFTNTVPIYIFVLKGASEQRNYSMIRLYNYKVYDNGTLVRNFIPALQKSTGKAGLYDLKNNSFYSDGAGGNFRYNSINNPINDINTLVLLNGDSLTDQSSYKNTATNNGIVLSKTGKFNKGALYLASGTYMNIPFSHTGDITVEGWFYQTSLDNTTYPTPYTVRRSASRGLYFHATSSNTTFCATSSSNGQLTGSGQSTVINKWVHYAQVQSGTTVYNFIDGQLKSTIANAHNAYVGLTIGTLSESNSNLTNTSCWWQGYISDLRITKMAKWTTNFTPPEAPQVQTDWRDIDEAYIKINKESNSGYTYLEYIESNGTQYIDTGFTPNQNTKIDIITTPLSVANLTGSLTDANGPGFAPYGAGVSAASRSFELYTWSNAYQFNYGSAPDIFLDKAQVGDRLHVIQDKNIVMLQINDNKSVYDSSMPTETFTCPCTLTLFAINRSGSLIAGAQKIHSCQIYDNGTLVRNFVPAMRNSDQMLGLYDKQNNVFYTDPNGTNFASNINTVDSATILMLDGKDFTDKSNSPRTITNNGVTLSNFGGGSYYFNGSSHLAIDPYNFSNKDFTIDWWECSTHSASTKSARFCSYYGTGANDHGGLLLFYTSGAVYWGSTITTNGSSAWNVISNWQIAPTIQNIWTHMAVVRRGPTLYIFVNGKLKGTQNVGTNSIAYNSAYKMAVGDYRVGDHAYYAGYLKDFRISKVARWTSEFTPPKTSITDPWKPIVDMYVKINSPAGYTHLDYLESTGTQYTNTGYTPSNNTHVIIDCIFPLASSSYYIFGARESSYVGNYSLQTTSNLYYSKHGTADTSISVPSITERTTIEKNDNFYRFGEYVGYNTPVTFTSPGNAYIFACNSAGSAYGICPAGTRIYHCEIYDGNGVLQRDLWPMMRNSDKKTGFYDVKNSVFYPNLVSTEFIYREGSPWKKI